MRPVHDGHSLPAIVTEAAADYLFAIGRRRATDKQPGEITSGISAVRHRARAVSPQQRGRWS
jgi:hypothetical protein